MRIIEIVISPDGQTHLETKGFSGSDCRIASHMLEQGLGQSTKERLTPEFYALASSQQAVQTEQ